jgi:hypothetical protein
MATNSDTGHAWVSVGLIVVIALLGAGFLYQREGGIIFGPNVQRENAEPTRPSDKGLSGNEPKGEPRTADPKPPEVMSKVGAVEVSLVQDERETCRYADWRLHVDGRIVAAKAEPFRWFVQPGNGNYSKIMDDSGFELLHVSKEGRTTWFAP